MAVTETEIAARTLADQMPILQVLIPFMAAPVIVIIGSRALAWPLAFASSLAALIISVILLGNVMDGSIISYQLGGWAPPLGIEYRVDAANAIVLFLISLMAAVTLLFARDSVEHEIPRRNHTLFYACFMLCVTGLLGVVITADAFNVFVFLEISSLSTYVLVAAGAERDRRALTAAFDYLILGTIGATFFVIGIGMLYMSTGTLNMADMAVRIADMGDHRTVLAGFVFIVVGIALKAAMFPLHLWLPNAYTLAPSAVTVFLAATATKAAIYVLLRFLFSVFTPAFDFELRTLTYVLGPLAVIAMFAGSFVAVFQSDFKRMLAYSSLAQIGYMLLGITMLNTSGITASIVHLFNHGITKGLLFMVVGAFVLRAGGSFYTQIEGLGRRMPITGATLVVGGLSLIGVPGTVGFVSKWMLVQGAFENGLWWLAILIVLSSLIAVVYVWRVVEVLYTRPSPADSTVTEVPFGMVFPMILLAVATIWFGIDTDLTLGAAKIAAEGLLAGPVPIDPLPPMKGGGDGS